MEKKLNFFFCRAIGLIVRVNFHSDVLNSTKLKDSKVRLDTASCKVI